MIHLKIDPEFRDKIPPMTEEQFSGLREDILRDGYVRDPLVVWKEEDTLLDGHHRWKIICENWETLKDKYNLVYLSFPDRWAALEWICRNQLNKHNLNDEQITYITGEMYKARKKSVGEHKGNQYSEVECIQNDNIPKGPNRTVKQIANELGIGQSTVLRAEKFHDGVDALREVSPEAADKVMRGVARVKKQDVIAFPQKTQEEQRTFAEGVVSGTINKKQKNHHSLTKKDKDAIAKTEEIIADMYDPSTVPEYTIDFLVDDIRVNGAKYIELLRNTLKDRSNLLSDENRPVIAGEIDSIINQIKSIKELVTV